MSRRTAPDGEGEGEGEGEREREGDGEREREREGEGEGERERERWVESVGEPGTNQGMVTNYALVTTIRMRSRPFIYEDQRSR